MNKVYNLGYLSQKNSVDWHRSLIENSADAVAVFSENGILCYVSPSVKNILGYTDDELMQMDLIKIVHPDALFQREQLMVEVLANPGKTITGFFKQMLHKDGTWRWIESTMTNMLHDASINGIVDNFRDVTERQVTQDKLKHRELRLKQAQEIAHFGNWEFDFSTGIVCWSEEACRIYGLSPQDNKHTYQSWVSFIHPDDLEYVMRVTKEAEDTLNNVSFYHRIIRRDSSVRHIHSFAHFEFNEAGEPVGLYGVAHDVTEVKEAEEKLKAGNLRLKKAQEIANYGGYEINLSTHIARWSEQFCKIYGLPPNDNIHDYASWLSFIHPNDVERVKNIIQQSNATLSNINFYYRIIRRDGTMRNIHAYRQIEFDGQNNPVSAFAVAHDITDETEHILQLKAQNAQLKEIAWIQSHKVRGPLATILGLAQLFKSNDVDNQTDEIIAGILSSSEKLDAVIREIVNKTSGTNINDPHAL